MPGGPWVVWRSSSRAMVWFQSCLAFAQTVEQCSSKKSCLVSYKLALTRAVGLARNNRFFSFKQNLFFSQQPYAGSTDERIVGRQAGYVAICVLVSLKVNRKSSHNLALWNKYSLVFSPDCWLLCFISLHFWVSVFSNRNVPLNSERNNS